MKNLLFVVLLMLTAPIAFSQSKPIGSWTEHLSLQSGRSVELANDIVYAGTTTGLFSYNLKDNSFMRFSTVNRLNDIDISAVNYSEQSDALMVVYSDLNIDLLKGSQTINIPAIKDASIPGKSLNNVYIDGSLAYLSTGFGLVKLDIERNEISETYQFADGGESIRVNACLIKGSTIYAATGQGLYLADMNRNLLDFNNWNVHPVLDANISEVFSFNDQLYAVRNFSTSDSIYRFDPTLAEADLGLTRAEFLDFDIFEDKLLIAYSDQVKIYDNQLNEISSITPTLSNLEDITFNNDRIFLINNIDPLVEFDYQNNFVAVLKPQGPFEASTFDVDVEEGVVWAVTGGYDQSFNNQFRGGRIFRLQDGNWTNFIDFREPTLNGVFDVIDVNIKPGSKNEVYFGSYGTGLVETRNGSSFEVFDETNSGLSDRALWPGWVGVGGSAFDEAGNLWVANTHSISLIAVRSPSGNWTNYDFPNLDGGGETVATEVEISESGYIWVALPRDNQILVLDPGQGGLNPSSSRTFTFKQGEGQGDLPGIRGITIAFDQNNQLWAGTSDGIAVKFNPDNIFEERGTGRDFERILIDDGENVEILLAGTEITDIEVDGANRKWVATNGSGVFLLSEDGKEVIQQFSSENSPLFSDIVLSIAIDEQSGEVYFATGSGLISYRGDVIEGQETISEVNVFPNPVRESYRGPIAIDGLIDQSTVKITDINGRLVNEIESKGGRAVWDGNNFQGNRVATGTYLVFSSGLSEENNLRTAISKILFIR